MSAHPGKIIIDLDGVLAGPRPPDGTYLDCEVNGPVVHRLRQLKAMGWTIAIHTSRNVKSHDHNVGKITAQTVPDIVRWLERNAVPYDELWPNKPWTGTVGFYVDDRAIRPSELLELNTSELLNRARGIAFDPTSPNWVAGTNQPWGVLDARSKYHVLVNGSALRSIKQVREDGIRTLILLAPDASITPGFDEQLRRLGARWVRFDPRTPFNLALAPALRELVLEGLCTYDTPVFEIYAYDDDEGVLESRHFNHVTADAESVTKTADDLQTQLKLHFEHRWHEAYDSLAHGTVTPGQLFPLPNGYRMRRARGGSLNHVLLRDQLSALDVEGLTQGLNELWRNLNSVMIDGPRTASERVELHRSLVVEKSQKRLVELGALLSTLGAGDGTDDWVVNGENLGSPAVTVETLLRIIPPMGDRDYGPWHGDLCPGNIVLLRDVHEDGDVELRLIDPRGTIDGENVALFGDQRYDLAKLAHALRWGYDAITEGFRDCFWRPGSGSLVVNLRVFDEDFPGFQTSRRRLWDSLVNSGVIYAGRTPLDDGAIHALAALQLITCAPLHREDPERVVALVARGLQAARYATDRLNDRATRPDR